jgi:prepilin-type N-terminal cleavage/methylation domain-containing protein
MKLKEEVRLKTNYSNSKQDTSNTKNKKGFTLIELVVVIAILSVLALIAIPSVIDIISNAKLSADQTTVRTLNTTTALMRTTTSEEDPFIDTTKSVPELFDKLIDGGYLQTSIQPQSSNATFVWLFNRETWYLLFEDSFYEVSLLDGITLATGGHQGFLKGSYTGTSKDIVIPTSLDGRDILAIYQQVFKNKDLVAISFATPSKIKQIHNSAFLDNKLSSIVLPNSIERIDYGAFMNNNLTEINLPANLKTLEDKVFFGNNDLAKITIGGQVSNIASEAFGAETAKFKVAYSAGGAGTYTWNGTNWIKQ